MFLKQSSHVGFTSHKSSIFQLQFGKEIREKKHGEWETRRGVAAAEPREAESDSFDGPAGRGVYGDVDGSEECLGRKISMAMIN